VVIAALAFRHIARRVTRQSTRAVGEVNKSIQEAVTGIRIAKNFRQEAQIYGEFTAVNNQSYTINVRRGFVLANIFPGAEYAGRVWYGRSGLFWWSDGSNRGHQHCRLVSICQHR
jgi:ATP-binding cassette, subfamily B, bacterial